MSDPTVEKWNQKGQIWIWRYVDSSRNYKGLHLTADPVACKTLRELFKLMENAQWPSTKELKISENEFVDPTGNNRKLSLLKSFRIKYRKGQVSDDYWNLELDSNRNNYILSIGKKKLKELDAGISDIERGHGDYAIGPEDNEKWDEMCLWFWWYVTKK